MILGKFLGWIEKWFRRFYALELLRPGTDQCAAFQSTCGDFAAWLVLPVAGIAFAVAMPTGFDKGMFGQWWFPWAMFGVTIVFAWLGLYRSFIGRLVGSTQVESISTTRLRIYVWTFRVVSAGIFFGGVILGGVLRGDFRNL